MRFSIDVHDTEVAGLLSGLVKITGIEPWKRRFEWLHRELNENHFMEDWLRERCLIEWTMNDILRDPSLMLQRPFRIENIAQYELVGFAAGTVRSYERLSAWADYGGLPSPQSSVLTLSQLFIGHSP